MFTRGTTTEALSQKEVPSGGLELNSGTGKGSRQMMLGRTLSPSRVVGRIMTSISRIKMKRVINLYGFLVSLVLLCPPYSFSHTEVSFYLYDYSPLSTVQVVYRSKVLFSGI